MPKQFLVVGAGLFGSAVATTLYQIGHEVVVIDVEAEPINQIKGHVTHAMIADATDPEILRQLGCSNFDAVIIAIGNDLESNILATVAAQDAKARKVISKAQSEVAAKILSRIGADQVIQPEKEMGVRLARKLATPEVLDLLALGENYGVLEIDVNSQLCGPLKDLQLPKRFGVQVVTINRSSEIFSPPPGEFHTRPGDKMLVIGENRAIEKLQDYLSKD
ncbi:MAG: TrkA family potassium uptake protein [Caldilineaceae bacterium]